MRTVTDAVVHGFESVSSFSTSFRVFCGGRVRGERVEQKKLTKKHERREGPRCKSHNPHDTVFTRGGDFHAFRVSVALPNKRKVKKKYKKSFFFLLRRKGRESVVAAKIQAIIDGRENLDLDLFFKLHKILLDTGS